MNTIGREELQEKLERKDDFKIVMTLSAGAFRAGHIPGSINISSMEQAQGLVSVDDEIVVYCHDENCPASKSAYEMLVGYGFTNVRRYAGGLRDWQEAGLPIERDSELKVETPTATTLTQPISGEDHRQGALDAEIQLLVHGDYECPYTRRAMTHIKGLRRRLGDSVCFVFRHFPAPEDIHPHAWIASEAALAADAQGKFWEMHKHLFKHQRSLTYDDLLDYAAVLKLDVTQFMREMDGHVHNGRIMRDRQSGWESGVRTVPTLFIDGIYYEGELKLGKILSLIDESQ